MYIFTDYVTYITAAHYFFLEIIGNDARVACTLNSLYVLINAMFHNGTLLKYTYGHIVTIEFDIMEDKTHNQEYRCIGYDGSLRIIEYVDVSVLALSELSKSNYKSLFSLHGFIIDWCSFAVPPHALIMHILSPDIAIAGDSLTLSLSAVKTSGFSNDPTISCINQNKTSLFEL